jgi:hypothetical protein
MKLQEVLRSGVQTFDLKQMRKCTATRAMLGEYAFLQVLM